jgi:hypothetical protein
MPMETAFLWAFPLASQPAAVGRVQKDKMP